MNKIHLFTNGDSNTYGSELLTNNSWPVMLSKKLNCTVDNYAFPGSSNDKIVRETTDYVVNNLNNADNLIVVLGFTEMSRIELFSDESKSTDFLSFDNEFNILFDLLITFLGIPAISATCIP